jgi:hypothetical protein
VPGFVHLDEGRGMRGCGDALGVGVRLAGLRALMPEPPGGGAAVSSSRAAGWPAPEGRHAAILARLLALDAVRDSGRMCVGIWPARKN